LALVMANEPVMGNITPIFIGVDGVGAGAGAGAEGVCVTQPGIIKQQIKTTLNIDTSNILIIISSPFKNYFDVECAILKYPQIA
jgi:hypothetical protein